MATMRRRTPLTFRRLYEHYLEDAIWWVVICFAVISVAGALIFWGIQSQHNTTTGSRESISRMLYSYGDEAHVDTPSVIKKREQVARQFVEAQNFGSRLGGSNLHKEAELSDQEWKSVVHTAKTGAPAVINTHRWSYGDVYTRNVYGIYGLLIQFLILSTILFLIYAINENEYDDEYAFADLPWRRVWPWFLTLAFGPIGWLSMAISAIRMPERHEPEARRAQVAEGTAANGATHETDRNQTVTRLSRLEPYESSPKTALAIYSTLRLDGVTRRRRHRITDLDERLRDNQQHTRLLTDELRLYQRQRGELTSERQRLEDAESQERTIDDPQVIRQEFDQIMLLPGVIAVQIVNSTLKFIVRSVITYRGMRYDGGDWSIAIDESTDSIRATLERSGLTRDWRPGQYPSYDYGSGTFCFGTRSDTINQHLMKQQYYEAMALAVSCLNSVNEGDEIRIPEAFRLIND